MSNNPRKRQPPPPEGRDYSTQYIITKFIGMYSQMLSDDGIINSAFKERDRSEENKEAFDQLIGYGEADNASFNMLSQKCISSIQRNIWIRNREYIMNILTFGREHLEYVTPNLSILRDLRTFEKELFDVVSHDRAVIKNDEPLATVKPTLWHLIMYDFSKYEIPLSVVLLYLVYFVYFYRSMFHRAPGKKILNKPTTMAFPVKCVSLVLFGQTKYAWNSQILLYPNKGDNINLENSARSILERRMNYVAPNFTWQEMFEYISMDDLWKAVLKARPEVYDHNLRAYKYEHLAIEDLALDEIDKNPIQSEFMKNYKAHQNALIRKMIMSSFSKNPPERRDSYLGAIRGRK